MIELVPSEWMRKYLKDQGREFSDKEKAALIWNAPNRTLSERLEALEELARGSSDEALKKQIKGRTEHEAAVIKALKENPNGQSVYVVIERSEHHSHPCGFFADFDDAIKYAAEYSKEYGCRCNIEKHSIVSKDNPSEKCCSSYFERASVYFNKSGEIRDVYSSEITPENINEQKGRFENMYFKIPFGMDYGIVKDVTENTYGVLAHNKEHRDRFMGKWSDDALEFGDIQVMVFGLTEKGIWSHGHINPLYLEPEAPENNDNDEKQAAFITAANALVEYFKHETEQNGKAVLDTAKAYADLRHGLDCKFWLNASEMSFILG